MKDALLTVAEALVTGHQGSPYQANLRRAVSTAYYTLFHAFATSAADLLASVTPRDNNTWLRVYRALDHGMAKAACSAVKNQRFSIAITECAQAFVELQETRYDSDYNPLYEVDELEARYAIDTARKAIEQLDSASPTECQQFAVYLLFRERR